MAIYKQKRTKVKKNRCYIDYVCLDPKCGYFETEGVMACKHIDEDGTCTSKAAKTEGLLKALERVARRKIIL